MTTEISTAARRIVRTVHEHRPGYSLCFDLSGCILDAGYGSVSATPTAPYVHFRTGRRITQHEAQDRLDALRGALTLTTDPGTAAEMTRDILQAWQHADELGRPRDTAATIIAGMDAVCADLLAEVDAR